MCVQEHRNRLMVNIIDIVSSWLSIYFYVHGAYNMEAGKGPHNFTIEVSPFQYWGVAFNIMGVVISIWVSKFHDRGVSISILGETKTYTNVRNKTDQSSISLWFRENSIAQFYTREDLSQKFFLLNNAHFFLLYHYDIWHFSMDV